MAFATFSLSSLVRQLILWSIYAIAILPVAPNGVNSVSMITFFGFSLILNLLQWKEGTALKKNKATALFFLIGGNFILLFLSLLYSIDRSAGIADLQGALPMILFPFCFFLLPATIKLTPNEMGRTLNIFLVSCVVMCLWLYYKLWQAGLFPSRNNSEEFVTVLRDSANEIMHKHPTYASLYLIFAIFIAFYHMLKTSRVILKIMYVLSIILFASVILELAARMPVIAAFIGIVFLLLWKIRSLKLKILLTAGTIVLFLCLVRLVPAIYSRVQETRNTMFKPPVNKEYNSTNIRAGIYECSHQVIREHWLKGVGVGSEKIFLSQCYSQFATEAYSRKYYNTHNEYVNFWLVTGIFSVLLFIGSIIYALAFAVSSKDTALFFFTIICAVSLLSENIFSRQAGIVFYYFFLTLLIHYRKVNRTSPAG